MREAIAKPFPDHGILGEEYGAERPDAEFVWVLDPIDGTRCIMHDKRSAWVLAGIAPQKGEATRLSDIVAASMTELPTTFGKYFLTEKLATGGMAEIYLAKLMGPGGFEKQLVIKQIHPRLSG